MSMNLTVYVGPYLVVPRSANIDLGDFYVVCDGRGEAGVGENDRYLIPNGQFVMREVQFSHGDRPNNVTSIDLGAQVYEMSAMRQIAAKLIAWCNENDVPYLVRWGVVPGLF